ncbi:MAG TPA: hypothetical protein VGO57_14155 [Verrucomicrobiae bacterium]|jgi:hypothetical protein
MGDHSNDDGSRATPWWHWLVAAVFIYLLPYIAVVIDERVLKTYWLARHLPHEFGDIARGLYPFYKFFKR